MGVVIAWIVSLALGSSIIYLSYHINHRIPLIELFPRESRIVAVTCLIAIALTFMVRHSLANILDTVALNILILFLPLIVIFFPIWVHPMRKRMTGWILSEIISKKEG